MRALTSNEAIAAGLNRNGLVLGALGEHFVLFETTGRRQWKMVDQTRRQAYIELTRYWSK